MTDERGYDGEKEVLFRKELYGLGMRYSECAQ